MFISDLNMPNAYRTFLKSHINYILCHMHFHVFLEASFFFYLRFVSRTFTNHRTAREGEGISLIPHYHFYPLHRHLELSRAITVEGQLTAAHTWQPESNWEPLVFERKSLTLSYAFLEASLSLTLFWCFFLLTLNIFHNFFQCFY